jgi:hypothetical protein
MRTDPTDNGGLFVGRRPGTAPVRYRNTPERGSSRRQHVDDLLALGVAALMVVVNLLFWGPIPAGALWIASRISGNGTNNIKRLDGLWILIRRAAGHDQRRGIIGPIFGVCAVVGGIGFTIWLVFIAGLGSSVMPGGS